MEKSLLLKGDSFFILLFGYIEGMIYFCIEDKNR